MALLACRVFEQEIALHGAGARHIRETRFFEVGLHDRPDELRASLQAELDSLGKRDEIQAVVLVYGLCGRGTADLEPVTHRLVIPRAHDCITLFMGSKEAFAQHQHFSPGCYYYSPGWNRARRVPGPDRLRMLKDELAKRFGPDDVEFLIDLERQQWALHKTATFLDLGTSDAEAEADYARQCAQWLGWNFQRLRGDPTLLRDLLWGNWDSQRFQIVEPGCRLAHSYDDGILRAERAETTTATP